LHTPHSHRSLDDFSTIRFCQCLILGRAGEYSHDVRVLQPMVLAILLEDIVATLCQLHPFPSNHVLPLIFEYKLEHTFVLDKTLFAHVLAIAPHLSSGGLFGMVYEYFSKCLKLEDPFLEISKLFQIVSTVAHGDIPRSVVLLLGVNRLVALVKDTKCFCSIAIGEVFLQLISCSIIL
jgi:hypothetical protein